MQKQHFKRLMSVGILAVSIAGFCTGCGEEEKIDYSIEGATTETQTQTNTGKSEVSQFADETSWNESWVIEEGVEEAVEITVDADIILPDGDKMSVVEVKVPKFDAAYKERMLKRLFDGQIYYGDADHILKEDSEEGYTPAEDYEGELYIGMSDEAIFGVWFIENEPQEQYLTKSRTILYYPRDMRDICPKGYEEYTQYMEHPFVSSAESADFIENSCGISEKEAEEVAREFVEKLGLEYPILTYTRPLLWGDDSMSEENAYNWPANGYVFHYEYGVEDTALSGYGKEGEYPTFTNWRIGEESQYSMDNELTVYVTDRGVIRMNANCPVETVGVTEDINLLPLDTIKEIMIEQTRTQYESLRFLHSVRNTELYFTHMELIYFRVRDKENAGHYSYVPAWRLSEQFGSKEMNNRNIKNPVIVNAIDGSLIHFYEET